MNFLSSVAQSEVDTIITKVFFFSSIHARLLDLIPLSDSTWWNRNRSVLYHNFYSTMREKIIFRKEKNNINIYIYVDVYEYFDTFMSNYRNGF